MDTARILSSTDVTESFKHILFNYINCPSFFESAGLCEVLRQATTYIDKTFLPRSNRLVTDYIKKHFPDNYSGRFDVPLVLPTSSDMDRGELAELAKQQYWASDEAYNFKIGSAYNELRMRVAEHMLCNNLFKVELLFLINEFGLLLGRTKITVLDHKVFSGY